MTTFHPESRRVGDPGFTPDIVFPDGRVIEFKTYPASTSVRGARLRNAVAWVLLWASGLAAYARAHVFDILWDAFAAFGIFAAGFILLFLYIK